MGKYLVLYRAAVTTAEQMNVPPEQAQAGMELWMKWAEKAGSSIVDLGMPLGEGKHITAGGASDGTTDIRGYTVIEAGSLEEAASLLKDHPHFHTPGDSSIEVLEFVPIPGM